MRILLLLFIGAAAILLTIRGIEARSIFFPMKGRPPVADNAVGHEEVYFASADGKKLHAWFVPAVDAGAGPVVLFLHGNAGNIGHRWDKIRILHDLGAAVFIFDYRGYGLSEGTPSEKNIHKDCDAAHAYLLDRGITSDRIVVYGESIGGAFAVDLASKKPVGALIVEDSFTSIPAMVRRSMPFIPGFALATRLDSLSKIPDVQVPKLIFHSLDDEIIPFEMGKALFEASAEPKRFVQLRGGHNTAFLDSRQTYENALKEFLEF